MFTYQFTRRYSMAHRLISGFSEKCATPHGHNELVTISLETPADFSLDAKSNMFAEFSMLKSRWHEWIDHHVDHALQLSQFDPLIQWFTTHEPQRCQRLLITPGDPTTECLAACFHAKINAFLAKAAIGLTCQEILIEETPTNHIRLKAPAHHQWFHQITGDYWWNRPDMSINDL
ncbi:MAG: 6-pyruvoyl trahydropterin synthase family protein [Alphaproteobacteria bacterium]